MKKFLHPFLIICLLNACSGGTEKKETTDNTNAQPKSYSACYAYRSATDTIVMNMAVDNNKVTGKLHFNFFEKDQNTGSINGHLNGDTLIADYRFMSEGVESVSEIIFLKKGDVYMQGYGELEELSGKTVFKDRGKLKFDDSYKLDKVVCE